MKKGIKIFVFLCIAILTGSKIYAQVSIGISVGTAPPALPVYVQPECPVDGYIWQPGYWAYDNADGYYWVPGAWVAPPTPGYYWTPAYWGVEGGRYGFHAGYWGPHIGFYGGINYGYGYSGHGYYGGRWEGNRFRYNTAVVRVNRTVIHNTYVDRRVIVRNNSRASFNGRGGVTARPRRQEQVAMRERHVDATPAQRSHQEAAQKNRNSFAKVNSGRPQGTTEKGRPALINHTENRNNPGAGRRSAPSRSGGGRPEQHSRMPQHGLPAAQRQTRPAEQRRPPQAQHPQQQHAAQPQRAPQQHASQPHNSARPPERGHGHH